MKRLHYTLYIIVTIALGACHGGVETWEDDPRGNFDALWTLVNDHYCFFAEKDIDWDEVYSRYSPRISDDMTGNELFMVCSDMLDELRDGHVNLNSPYATSYYRKWWSDYPENYSGRLIQESYFNFNYRSIGTFIYGFLPENVGYIHYSSFSSGIGEGNLDYILSYFASAQGLIIDVRNNGGGNITNVETLVSRFITRKTLAGYMSHKTGPGHNDFSTPEPYYFHPADASHIVWGKPVVVLANRGTFSAANNFVSVMKLIPGVTVMGATTGGGSGMPVSYEIPNGWGIRMSATVVLDAEGRATENGVDPTPGYAVDMNVEDALEGHDTILDTAIGFLTNTLNKH